MAPILSFLKDLLLAFLFTYGLLYISYKYGQPDLGNFDYFKYEQMVEKPMDMQAVKAPFVLRQIPCLIAIGFKESGIYYPNEISYARSALYTGINSQKNYFALLLSNYLAFILAIAIIISYLKKLMPGKKDHEIYFPVLALSLGYFMVPLNVIAPLTQGYGWLTVALITIGFLERKLLVIACAALVAAFSRETVLIFFTLIVFFKIVFDAVAKKRGPLLLQSLVVFLILFVTLYLLRTNFTHGNEGQFSLIYLLGKTINYEHKTDYIFQAFITQGLLIFLVLSLWSKAKKTMGIYLCSMLVIILIGGNGVGRIIGESYPFLVLLYLIPGIKRRDMVLG